MPECNVSGRRADYALLGPDGRLVATIEAKKLGESLAAHEWALRLMPLWRPNLGSGRPVAADEPLFGRGVSAAGFGRLGSS